MAELPPAALPSGIMAGDVSQGSVVLWAQAAETGIITFTLESVAPESEQGILRTEHPLIRTATVTDSLLPVTVTLTGLTPGIVYDYQVTTAAGSSQRGHFRTPAPLGEQRGLRFGVSGDWRGDMSPYIALANAAAQGDRSLDLDFFVALGDVIYADFPSPAVPEQARTPEAFLHKYTEVYATRLARNPWAALRASTVLFATIDDHEVLNNFAGGAPAASSPYFGERTDLINEAKLYRYGLDAFLAYTPLRHETYPQIGDHSTDGRPKLYRYRTFGTDAALFILDARSFRDTPLPKPDITSPDDIARFQAETFTPGRTMLGRRQLDDLLHDLAQAQQVGITWKFIALPEPIQTLDMVSAQDRYQGYAAERSELLRFIQEESIENVIFIAADIHGTVVNNLAYQNGSNELPIPIPALEVTVGPVAFYAPYGLTKVWTLEELGLLREAEISRYYQLPVANDEDSDVDDRDDFIKAYLNEERTRLGYDSIGLADSSLDATLLAGDYIAVHTYGWTEFAIDADSQRLTVTTYGIAPYRATQLEESPEQILQRTPEIVSRFELRPLGN